jgi:site-specific recombinase XerD
MDDVETAALLTSWNLALHDKAKSTRGLYLDVLGRFARSLPDGRGLLDATTKDCRTYFAQLGVDGLSRATIRSRWIAMRSFYRWARDEDEIDTNPMDGVKVERATPPPTKFPDDVEVSKLLKSMSGRAFLDRRDLAMVRLAAATGLRISELCALTVDDLDLPRGVVLVRHGKGDRSRLVAFDPETGAVLDRYLRVRARQKLGGKYRELFLSRFGPFGRKGATHMLIRRCEQAGIKPFGWHALRHRFAHSWLERGGHEGALQRLGGWQDPGIMRRYGAALATQRAVDEYAAMGGVL